MRVDGVRSLSQGLLTTDSKVDILGCLLDEADGYMRE